MLVLAGFTLIVAVGPAATQSVQQISGGGQPPAPRPRDTLVVAIEEDVNTLDPAAGLGTHTLRTVGNAYESLVDSNTPNGSIEPSLATSWTVSADGREYVFKLRKNVKFQDGTPFNATAVKFSFDRALIKTDPYYYGPYTFPSFFLASLQKVDVVDDSTVKFTLKQPDPTFLGNLVWTTSAVVSPTALKKYGREFPFHGAGTGAFMIVRWDKGSRLVMTANPNYWGGAPKIKTLIFKPVPEEAARLNQLKSGDVDIVAALNPQLLPEVVKDPRVKALVAPGIHTWFVMLNTSEKPLNDPRVREALNYAIDEKAIVDKILNGAGIPSSSFTYPGTWSYTPSSEIYTYNPAKAKQLLAEAGYPNGFELNFLVPQSGSGMIAPKEIATVIQAYLGAVGIKVNIDTLEWVTYLNAILTKGLNTPQKTYAMGEMSWMSTAADPGLYVNYYLLCDSTPAKVNGFNDGYYCDKKVAGLLQAAMQTVDQNKRAALYKQAEVLVAQDAPWLFVFHAKNVIGLRADVQGVLPYPNMNTLPIKGVYIGSH